MAIRRAVVLGISHNGVMPDIAHRFFAGQKQQIVFIGREFGLQDFQGDKPPRDFRSRSVNVGCSSAPENGFDAVGVIHQIARFEQVSWTAICHNVSGFRR